MGLSQYPTPTDGGVLCIILVNTAISINIVKDLVLSILRVVGIRVTSSASDDYSIETSSHFHECQCRGTPSETYMEEFRIRTPSVRFDSVCKELVLEQECPVCLSEYAPESEINHLPCGHLFHKVCLEKWLKGWNVTCPICRSCMVPQEEEDCPPM